MTISALVAPVALTVQRDLDSLRSGVARWLGAPVRSLTRAAVGFSCETLIVDEKLVLRLPPLREGIFPDYDLPLQAEVQRAAGAAGVPVAAPIRIETDRAFLGTVFLAMPFVPGAIPSGFTPADVWLGGLASDSERRSVWDGFIDALIQIHRTPLEGLAVRRGLDAELDAWGDYVYWASDGSPPAALVDVLAWCRTNRPASEPPAGLLWGDVRFGNVIFDTTTLRPAAVLDWDMATAGPFELDLAWFLALEQMQTDLSSMSVPGFGNPADAIARAEARLGRALQPLDWYEVFALARASAISTRIAILHQRAGLRTLFRVGEEPTLAAAVRRIS